ncbi:MAG: hypothetical protein QW481_07155 [Candidatus Methanomethylicia archaeon]
MGKLCGVQYYDPSTSSWKALEWDKCGGLTNKTVTIKNFPANTSFYLKLQYDCEKYWSPIDPVPMCPTTIKLSFSYTTQTKEYSYLVGGIGEGKTLDIPEALPSPPVGSHTITVEAWEGNVFQDRFYINIEAVQPGSVVIDSVILDKYTVLPGENFTVIAYLSNRGSTPAVRIIYFKVDGFIVSYQTVVLQGGTINYMVKFTYNILDIGTHEICVE